MIRTRSQSTIVAIVVATLILMWCSPASYAQTPESTPVAADDGRISKSFQFYPVEGGFGSFFEPEIAAGGSAQLTVLLGNTGEVEQGLRTFAINAFTAQGGGFASAEYGTPPDEVTGWLDYPEETFELKSGEGVERTFNISVPEGTAPGEYITALATEHADATVIDGTDSLSQKLRYTIPVLITVPGPTETIFEVGEISFTLEGEQVVLAIPILNTGDIRVRPEGTIEIVDDAGSLIASIPVAMQSVYAREGTVLGLSSPATIPAGNYRVIVKLTDPDSGAVASRESSEVFIDPSATPVASGIQIDSIAIAPGPDATNVQFANVEATITNEGEPIGNAQLSLIASLNGVEVERFPVVQALSLQSGETPITTRYIPATGWTSGSWTFELLIETVEPGGAAVVVARQPVEGSITIP